VEAVMRSGKGKRYTNTTFTRRVDRDAGLHRPPRAPSEPRVCGTCGAVYRKRRWVTADTAGLPEGGEAPPVVTTCPACRKIAANTPSGFVYLSGSYLTAHHDEIVRLLQGEARRAAEDNPTGRIIAWEHPSEGQLLVTTTTEHLAQRLGQALGKACAGDLRYDFSHENKLARVYWHRD